MRYLLSLLLVFGIAFAQESECSKKTADLEKKIEVKKEVKDGKVLVTVTEDGKTEVHEFDINDAEAMAKIHAKIEAGDDDNIKIIKKIKGHDCKKENCDPKTCEYALKGKCDKDAMDWHMKDKGDLKKMKILKKGKMPEDHIFIDDKGGYLGVYIQDLSEQLGEHFKVKNGNGVLVSEVIKDSPAEKAGLKAGDIITKVNDKPVKTAEDLTKTVRAHEPKDKVAISVLRNGKKKQLKATLGESENILMPEFGDFKNFDKDHKMFLKMAPEHLDGIEVHKFPFDNAELKEDLEEIREELKELKAELKKLKETK